MTDTTIPEGWVQTASLSRDEFIVVEGDDCWFAAMIGFGPTELPADRYRVVVTDDGWNIYTADEHGAFT